jgi:probable HAF family extracellular repeat protein
MRRQTQAPRSRRSCRPQLEALEDRCVPTTYAITDLGTNLIPVALNNLGDVAGVTTGPSGQATAFLLKDGTLTLTGLSPVFLASGYSMGLNDSDQVVAGNLWSDGTVTPLPIYGSAISDDGTIVQGFNGALVDQNGTVTALPGIGNSIGGGALAISNNGQWAAGYAGPGVNSIDGSVDPFLWNLATGQAIDLGGDGAEGTAVNNAGQVIGFDNLAGAPLLPFLYSNGTFTDLGGLPGATDSAVNGINNAGVVVGSSTLSSGASHAFLYSNGAFTDVNNLVPAGSGFTVDNAVAINDSGQILATTTNGHAVLLNPVPSLSMTLSGFPPTTTAGVAHSVTVTVLNPDGSIDTGYTGTVHFTSSDPQAALPADYTFTAADAGAHTFSVTLKTADSQSFTVTDTTTTTLFASQQGITVEPAAATHFAVLVSSNTVSSGQSFYILVEALDPYGNIDYNYTGTVHFTSSDRSASLPANYTFKAGVGDAYFLVKLRTRSVQTITLVDTLHHSIAGSVTMNVT